MKGARTRDRTIEILQNKSRKTHSEKWRKNKRAKSLEQSAAKTQGRHSEGKRSFEH